MSGCLSRGSDSEKRSWNFRVDRSPLPIDMLMRKLSVVPSSWSVRSMGLVSLPGDTESMWTLTNLRPRRLSLFRSYQDDVVM